MKKLVMLVAVYFTVIQLPLFSQNIFQATIRDSITSEKLIGVSVLVKNTDLGSASDQDGFVEIANIPDGVQTLVISYIGYEKKNVIIQLPSDNEKTWNIVLAPDVSDLVEVIISTTRSNSRVEDAPQKIEILGLEEMSEENAIKPGNVASILGDISSIQIQQLSPVSGNAVVRMQGLDGKYTMLLRDGMPSYGGLSGGLNILQIPPLDLQQIEILKGPSSTINGGGAVAGLINFISKLPSDSSESAFTINQSTLSETNLNAYTSGTVHNAGYTLLGAYTTQQPVDVNNDNYSDVPLLQSFLLHPQFFYKFSPQTKLRLGLITTMEDRTGGDMQAITKSQDTIDRYFENIKSVRNGFDLLFENNFRNKNILSFKGSVSQFNRNERTNMANFNGNQWNVYSEIFYSVQEKRSNILFGANYLQDKFKKYSLQPEQLGNYDQNTIGLFAQYSLFIDRKINLQAGIRTDHHSDYGWFILPSVAALIHAGPHFSFRINGGSGYKTPNLLDVTQSMSDKSLGFPVFAQDIQSEQSIGGTIEWNYKKLFDNGFSLFVNQTFFYTVIQDAIIMTTLASGDLEFRNIDGHIFTRGIDNYIRFSLKQYELYLGYTYTRPEYENTMPQPVLNYTPQHRAALTFVDEFSEHWRGGIEASYNGSQYREDGTKTPDYVFLAASVQYKIQAFSFVLNGENLTNFIQSDYETIVSGPPGNPVFAHLWAPVDGRVINFSVLYRF